MVSVFFSLLLSFQARAELLPGEDLYLRCVSPQWQVEVMRVAQPDRDQWRMEVSRNTVRGWELLENESAVMEPKDPERIPSPTVFRTPNYRIEVLLNVSPAPGRYVNGTFYDQKAGELIRRLPCLLPWAEEK